MVNPVTGAVITPSGVLPGAAAALSPHGLDPNFSNPYSHSWDLTLEQQLPLHSSLTIGYVGNRGMRLPIYIDTNIDPNSATFNHTYRFTNPKTGAITNYTQEIFTDRLYTNIGLLDTGFSSVNSNYHSMIATLKKPFSHNTEILVNYTWAKEMDGGASTGSYGSYSGGDVALIPFAQGHRQGLGAEYARGDLDMRGRFVGTITTKSNFGIANRYAAYAINGWLFGATYTAQSGLPVTATTTNSISISSLVPAQFGKPLTDGGPSNAVQTLYGPSTRVPDFVAARNGFKGPGLHNLDARVSREFPILSNRYRFEVAAEAFNVVNHRNIFGVSNAYVTYVAPGGAGCPTAAANPGTVGCFNPLSSSTTPFMAPTSTSGTNYGPRQLQLVGKFTF